MQSPVYPSYLSNLQTVCLIGTMHFWDANSTLSIQFVWKVRMYCSLPLIRPLRKYTLPLFTAKVPARGSLTRFYALAWWASSGISRLHVLCVLHCDTSLLAELQEIPADSLEISFGTVLLFLRIATAMSSWMLFPSCWSGRPHSL